MEGDARSPWIFANQSGATVLSRTRADIERMLSSGVMRVIGNWQPFDRALVTDVERCLTQFPPEELFPSEHPLPDTSVGDATPHEVPVSLELGDVELDPPVLLANDTVFAPSSEPLAGGPRELAGDNIDTMRIALETADSLEIGARLMWYRPNASEMALKLGIKVRTTGKFILVDRAGLRQLEADRDMIAALIASGELAVLDAGSRFDSALEKIVKQMQKETR
jgi:hypothetical protein